jgi:hypothetical protein
MAANAVAIRSGIGFLMKIAPLVNRSISQKGNISQNETIED